MGTIERVNRFLDFWPCVTHPLFGDPGMSITDLLDLAKGSPSFQGVPLPMIRELLLAARKAERMTRHKQNSNIPSYGSRAALIEAGILTDTLPVV